jgi:hypothetical protein
MIINSRDPDIDTIIGRINRGIYDLKPDFQRDVVWTVQKQQKLIDSIMRGWHIPPIHLVQIGEKDHYEVLDGKQRLYSIYNFVNNKFSFNGNFLPELGDFSKLHNKKYSDLPTDIKNFFDTQSIRIFLVSDVRMSEATELFLRLNQGVLVSEAEKRNCIYGPVKEFLREALDENESLFREESLGFKNNRMAYQDVIDRLLFFEFEGGFNKKLTSRALELMYYKKSIDEDVKDNLLRNLKIAEEAFTDFFKITGYKLTKNTLISYYWFLRDINYSSPNKLKMAFGFIPEFEKWRESQKIESEKNIEVDKKYVEFSIYLSKGWLDRSSLEGRHRILKECFANYCSQIKTW